MPQLSNVEFKLILYLNISNRYSNSESDLFTLLKGQDKRIYLNLPNCSLHKEHSP